MTACNLLMKVVMDSSDRVEVNVTTESVTGLENDAL